jgi:xanthine/uracil/vitamin C permease (AzgA family)
MRGERIPQSSKRLPSGADPGEIRFRMACLSLASVTTSHGLAAGFVSYAGMKLAAGRAREAHGLVYAIALLFAWRYLFLS